MKAIYFLALNHLKKRWKTVLGIVAAVTICVAGLITFLSLTNGYQQSLLERILGIDSHIQIDLPYGSGMEEYRHAREIAVAVEGVRRVEPLLVVQGFLRTPGRTRRVYLWGIDEESELSDRELGGGLAVWGEALSRELNIGSGSLSTVTVVDGEEIELEYAGSFDAGLREYNEQVIFVDIEMLLERVSHRDRALVARVDVEEPFRVSETAEILRGELPYRLSHWKETYRNILSAFEIERRLFTVVFTLMFVTTGFGIFSTLHTFALEKRRSMGLLRAFGATPRQVKAFYLFQGLFIGKLGSLLGVLLGVALTLLLSAYPIELPGDVYDVAYLPVRFDYVQKVAVVLLASVISTGASLYPAVTAARVDPVEVLRDE